MLFSHYDSVLPYWLGLHRVQQLVSAGQDLRLAVWTLLLKPWYWFITLKYCCRPYLSWWLWNFFCGKEVSMAIWHWKGECRIEILAESNRLLSIEKAFAPSKDRSQSKTMRTNYRPIGCFHCSHVFHHIYRTPVLLTVLYREMNFKAWSLFKKPLGKPRETRGGKNKNKRGKISLWYLEPQQAANAA